MKLRKAPSLKKREILVYMDEMVETFLNLNKKTEMFCFLQYYYKGLMLAISWGRGGCCGKTIHGLVCRSDMTYSSFS